MGTQRTVEEQPGPAPCKGQEQEWYATHVTIMSNAVGTHMPRGKLPLQSYPNGPHPKNMPRHL